MTPIIKKQILNKYIKEIHLKKITIIKKQKNTIRLLIKYKFYLNKNNLIY